MKNLETIDWREQINVPNTLTLLRLLAIPWMANEIIESEGRSVTAIVLFFVIWSTDALDGYLARKYELVTPVGKLLDPLADKLFQITTAYCLYLVGRLPLWICIFLLLKDLVLVLGGGRLYKEGVVVSARMPGKIATVLMALGFGLVLLLPEESLKYANYIIYASLAMGVIAFIQYAMDYFKIKQSGETESCADKRQV